MAILDILVGAFFVIGGGAFLFYGIRFVCKNERKKWQKRFNEINIGDKFIQKLNQPDPFEPQYYQIVTISDKAMNADGDCYLKYKIEQCIYEPRYRVLFHSLLFYNFLCILAYVIGEYILK